MSGMPAYRPGVPCWVEALEPDAHAGAEFYGAVFGWDAAGPGATPDGGAYFVARLDGDDVAGIAPLPPGGIAEPAWTTYVWVAALEPALQRVRDAGGTVVVAPLDAPPAGRLAIVASPSGATLGLWQAAGRRGAQRINAPGAWAMSALRTPDLDAAVPFYQRAFGWYAEPFEADGTRGVLFRLPGYVGGTPHQPVPRDVVAAALEDARVEADHWSVDFWVDDIEAVVARAWQHGGTILACPFDASLFRRSVLASPGGAVFTVSQLVRERLPGVTP